MKVLKKYGVIIVAVILVLCCVIPVSVSAASGYSFKSRGSSIMPGANSSAFIKANKKDLKKTTNNKTCVASSGYDVTRQYKYFTIVTYATKKNGEGKLESIEITNKNVKTPEGLSCGMDESEIKTCYKNVKKVGQTYRTDKGKTRILIKVDAKKKVSSIEYVYTGSF